MRSSISLFGSALLPSFLFLSSLLLSTQELKAQSIGSGAGGSGAGTKENLDLPFNALGAAEDEEDAPEVVTFYGQQLEGDGFFYVIDHSLSMTESGELIIAKREVVRNISEFSERVEFGLVFFAAQALKFPSTGQPTNASPGMKQAAINFTNSIGPDHGSCVQKGMAAILQMANQATSKRKIIVYVGDGGGTCGGGDEATYLRQTIALVSALNYQRIQINAIGVLHQPPINEAFLKQLASSNGGTFTRVTR